MTRTALAGPTKRGQSCSTPLRMRGASAPSDHGFVRAARGSVGGMRPAADLDVRGACSDSGERLVLKVPWAAAIRVPDSRRGIRISEQERRRLKRRHSPSPLRPTGRMDPPRRPHKPHENSGGEST